MSIPPIEARIFSSLIAKAAAFVGLAVLAGWWRGTLSIPQESGDQC